MNASEFGCGAAHQLVITAAKAGWELEDFSTLQKSEEKCRQVLQFLRGEAELVPKVKLSPASELVMDPIIRVDRSIRPSYPDWMKEVMHQELENVGPAEYDITKVEQWLHDGQKDGKWIKGKEIYARLKDTDTLKTCLGLRDLEEIQRKGIAFFRKHFKGKAVFGWSGVVRGRDGRLKVPYLDLGDGCNRVELNWDYLVGDWISNCPGLRHAS
jgi:hypothetical protein